MPSVACKSRAMGVSRLTGMNSEAMSSATHKAMEPTALHLWREENSRCGEGDVMSRFRVFLLL